MAKRSKDGKAILEWEKNNCCFGVNTLGDGLNAVQLIADILLRGWVHGMIALHTPL